MKGSEDHPRNRESSFPRRLSLALGAAIIAPLALSLLFLVPTHKPQPNGLPVAVVGAESDRTGIQARLEAAGYEVHRAADEAAARESIGDRDVYGAIVLEGGKPTAAITASGGSFQAADQIATFARGTGAKSVSDIRPLVAEDPTGNSLNQLVLPIIFTGTLIALAGVALLPRTGIPGRAAVAVGGSVLAGLVLAIVGRELVEVVPGDFLAEVGIFFLATLAIALTTGGMLRLIGFPAMGLAFLFFVAFGNPASGLTSAPELLTEPWGTLGQLLPPGAAGTALRGEAYFDGAATAGPILVLLGWIALGLVLLVIAERRHPEGEPIERPA